MAVSGHNPNLVIGDLEGVRVAVFGAREHYYESGNPTAMRVPLGAAKLERVLRHYLRGLQKEE